MSARSRYYRLPEEGWQFLEYDKVYGMVPHNGHTRFVFIYLEELLVMLVRKKNKTVLGYQGIILPVIALLLAACGTATPFVPVLPPGETGFQEQQTDLVPSESFTFRSESEDGTLVEARAFSSGYRPGDEFPFFLDVHNGREEPWTTTFCLQLLNEDGIVATMIEDQFSLQPGEGFGTMLVATYPAGIPEGAYGLALVIPERTASVAVIHLGDVQTGSGGPFPAPACP